MRTIGSLALVGALALGGAACGGGGSSASFCSELKSQSSELSKPNMSDSEALKKSAAAFKSLEAKAPAEIKDDMKVLADYLDKVANTDTSNLSAAAEPAGRRQQDPDREREHHEVREGHVQRRLEQLIEPVERR